MEEEALEHLLDLLKAEGFCQNFEIMVYNATDLVQIIFGKAKNRHAQKHSAQAVLCFHQI